MGKNLRRGWKKKKKKKSTFGAFALRAKNLALQAQSLL